MRHDSDPTLDSQVDDALSRELEALPQVDLAPLAARALLVRAQRRLTRAEKKPSWLEKHETTLLVALSATHLVWGLLHAWKP